MIDSPISSGIPAEVLTALEAQVEAVAGALSVELPGSSPESDMYPVARHVVAVLGPWLDAPRLVAGLRSQAQLDLKTLDEIADALAKDASDLQAHPNAPPIVASAAIANLKKAIASLSPGHAPHSPMQVLLTLQVVIDGLLQQLLLALPKEASARDLLYTKLKEKLGVLDEDSLLRGWSAIVSDFEGTEPRVTIVPRFDATSGRLPSGFLQLPKAEDARERIPQYMVHIRPALVRDQLDLGRTMLPGEPVSIAWYLARTDKSSSVRLTQADLLRAATLMKIGVLVSLREPSGLRDIADSLGVDEGSEMFKSSEDQSFRESLKGARAPSLALALAYELRKLLSFVRQDVVAVPTIARLLWQHKLAMEVDPETSAEPFRRTGSGHEVHAQRRLCSYLLDRGILCFGTKFGPSETDIVGLEPRPVLAEVKIFRKKPNPAQVQRAMVQLRSYMDQPPIRVLGILVVYNLSDTLITAARNTWVEGRVLVVPVNIGSVTPSRRDHLVEIYVEGTERELRFRETGPKTGGGRQKKPSKAHKSAAKAKKSTT